MTKTFSKFFLALFVSINFLFAFSCSVNAAGATLFISPNSGDYTIGKSFSVKVMVNSGGGDGINAAEGVIKFDPEYLTVSSLSDVSSIFKLWTTNPTHSNTKGTITYGGGSPGAYKGTTGEIFSVIFSTKKAGTTDVSFTSGIVLAADGKGTNVFSGFGNAKFNIKEEEKKEEPVKKEPTKKEEPKEEPVQKGIQPPIPEVDSITHPDTEVWYSNNEPEFTWKILSDLTGVSFSISDDPSTDPGPTSDGIVESQKFEPQKDGEQYFHIKYQNKSGWGPITHRKLLIDVTPPEAFKMVYDNGGDPTNPAPKIRFKTKDETSGIESYESLIGNKKTKLSINDVNDGYYVTEILAPGEYDLNMAAIDKAGNIASSSITFTVDALKAPIITSIPTNINKNEELIIQGTSFYPRVSVKLYISTGGEENEEYTVMTDDQGNWSYFHKGDLEKGNYEIWARIVDERGAQSYDSTRHLLNVISLSIIEKFGFLIIMILIIIIILLIMYIIYQDKKFNEERMRIRRETQEVKSKLGKIFMALREEVDELIEMADKKVGLSDSERRVKEKLQESLDISEEFINKEVEDVEKEIKLSKKDLQIK